MSIGYFNRNPKSVFSRYGADLDTNDRDLFVKRDEESHDRGVKSSRP